MRSLCPAFALAFIAVAGARGGEFVLFKHVWGDVVAATDTTQAGHLLSPPTPAHPVYYQGLSLGSKLGSIGGDDLPDVKKLNKLVADVLARQGYVYASPGGPEPTLFLIVQWGYLRPGRNDLMWFLGLNPDRDLVAPILSHNTEVLVDYVSDALYGIIVTAFDFKTANTAHPTVYWQTRIGLPAVGKSMGEALPTMLVAAGPSIGREARLPVLHDADHARGGFVKLGELKILETDAKPEAANPPDRAKK